MTTSSKKALVALLTAALVGELMVMSPHVFAGGTHSSLGKKAKKKQQNPLPFRPPSYYLNEIKGISKEDQKALDEEDYKNAQKDNGKLEKHLTPDDVVTLCASYLEPATACKAMSRNNLQKMHKEKDALFLNELNRQFITIPKGFYPLPSHLWEEIDGAQRKFPVAAFETTRYPVTRAFWKEVMGGMPAHVPANERATWDSCPDCPVTYVDVEDYELDANGRAIPIIGKGDKYRTKPAEIQEFLTKLNERTAKNTDFIQCTYELPSWDQLFYSIRGDVTGENKDPFSKGVTKKNVNEYFTHAGNSNGKIQPVGQKKLNEFGIELGNVQKISKTPALSHSARITSSGRWNSGIMEAATTPSEMPYITEHMQMQIFNHTPSYHNGFTGFGLVRKCQSASTHNQHPTSSKDEIKYDDAN